LSYAPTGRAAKRMTEVTGAPAGTLHRVLEYDVVKGRFARRRVWMPSTMQPGGQRAPRRKTMI
jgi:ATP-dependent exoDNAse (exonuclease V) alpha subunit